MLLAEMAVAQACPSHRFLEEMAKIIPWELFEAQLKEHIRHKPGGRPPFSRLLLFKIHLLQTWFHLSDAQAEFQCRDRLSFRKFLDLGIEDTIPDSTTIETFRHELLKTDLYKMLLEQLDRFLKRKSCCYKRAAW